MATREKDFLVYALALRELVDVEVAGRLTGDAEVMRLGMSSALASDEVYAAARLLYMENRLVRLLAKPLLAWISRRLRGSVSRK